MSGLQSLLHAIADRLCRPAKRVILLATDAALAPVALAISGLAVDSGVPETGLLALAALVSGACSAATGLHRIKLDAYEGRALLRTCLAGLWATLLLVAMARYGTAPMAVDATLLFGLLLPIAMASARAAMRHGLRAVLRLGQPCARVIIYGAGATGVQLAAALQAHGRISVAGFVDDSVALQGLTVAGLRVYGSDRIAVLARRLGAERVLLAMPSAPDATIARIERRLRALGLVAVRMPSFACLAGAGTATAPDGDVPARLLGRPALDAALVGCADGYAGQVVMVTGAGGSVGTELCRQISAMRPAKLILFELSEYALYRIERDLREAGPAVDLVPILGSVTDAPLLRRVLLDHSVTVVLHAAAYKHVPLVEANPVAGLSNNVLGTRSLAEATVACGVRRFVLVSSDKAVRPASVMGATKRAAELVVQDMARHAPDTAFAIVRFGNVMESSGSVVPLFRDQIARGGPVTVTDGEVTRYFMTLAEAARLVLVAGSFPGPVGAGGCDVFVLDMGRPVRIRHLAVQMIEAAGHTVRDDANPSGEVEIRLIGLRRGEKLHEELVIGDDLLPTPHPKIHRAAERRVSALQVAAMLREVRAAVATGEPEMARAVIFAHVETPGDAVPAMAAE